MTQLHVINLLGGLRGLSCTGDVDINIHHIHKLCNSMVHMFSPISERLQIERRLQIESALYLYPAANVETDRPSTSSDL